MVCHRVGYSSESVPRPPGRVHDRTARRALARPGALGSVTKTCHRTGLVFLAGTPGIPDAVAMRKPAGKTVRDTAGRCRAVPTRPGPTMRWARVPEVAGYLCPGTTPLDPTDPAKDES
ncbi:hypothetical protein Saso_40030 [Streptomyces asoensis]|uniref:Uncharacterized protein n=1 Tax=Streptomyces asoensis TaxID=249586 RepID=A0ABQ3S2K5_9ACTN|nr:hypothetical protein GCM10010496_63540 [Streptomyces asoensis]GHI62353.1 hypothetical protein Saso_40030 [Streptomyces asoensis]